MTPLVPGPGVSEPVLPRPLSAAPAAAPEIVQAGATAPAQGLETPPAARAESPLRGFYNRAAEQYATIDSYIARLRRREEIHGKSHPEEVMLVKFRKQPWSVYFKWIGPEGHGREVTYVRGQHGDQIHTLLAQGDHPFLAGGKRMSVAPDNIFIKSRTRHSIQEAGIGAIIDKFGVLVESAERGDTRLGTITYLGRQKRPEYESPMEAVERVLPPGCEPQLPRGGRRWLFFDSASGLPVLTITHDDGGREVEYYCYDLIQHPVRLDDDDFNPDRLWPTGRR